MPPLSLRPSARPRPSPTLRPDTRAQGAAGRGPTAFRGACRPRHPLGSAARFGATAAARSHRPPRLGSARLRPSRACPAPCRPSRAGLNRNAVTGPQLRPQGSKAVRESRGWEKSPAGAERPSALTMATPLDLQQTAPSARGATRGQVTRRPLEAPPSVAPPAGRQRAPRLARS